MDIDIMYDNFVSKFSGQLRNSHLFLYSPKVLYPEHVS